jgi:hypothetical protein
MSCWTSLSRAVTSADRAWVADTTYLPVLGGFIFLVVVLDLFSRKVVGWSVGDRLDAELSGEALRRALARRRPGPGLLFHSDRGIEFAAKSFRAELAHAGAVQSMKGNILAGRLVERDHEIIRRACLITRSCFLDCSHELGSRENFVRVSGPVDV